MTNLNTKELFSLEAERGLLGSMMFSSKVIPLVMAKISADSFGLTEHQILFDCLIDLFLQKCPVDLISVLVRLKEVGLLQNVGGEVNLRAIVDSVCHAENAEHYVRLLLKKEKLRQAWTAIEKINAATNTTESPEILIELMREAVLELDAGGAGDDFVELKNIVGDITIQMRDTEDDAIKTSFHDLDRLISGFYPGEFIIIAGRPSMGKSAFALDICLLQEIPTLYITCEMTIKALVERAICGCSHVSLPDVRAGLISESRWDEIYEQSLALAKKNLILTSTATTPEKIAGLIHRLKITHKIQLVVVDYIQLLGSNKKTENRNQEISLISRKLKMLAVNEGLPIIGVSQLNRASEAREHHRPRMSDLRESGSLEQDADLIILLHREDYYKKGEPDFIPTGICEIMVVKNRRGATGKTELVFLHDYCTFKNMAKGDFLC